MSQLISPSPGLFFASFLYRNDLHNEQELLGLWEAQQGESLTYTHSYFPMADYYSKEMGERQKLSRFFAISLSPTERQQMVPLKVWATEQEERYNWGKGRGANIDIGLVTLENVTLATGKNFVHRTFLGAGVFSDLTLMYEKGSFVKLPWSYPDYSHCQVIDFFNWSRRLLQQKLIS